jgi:protein-S-isoprenylcysteine O-methyltransferase Ste14
MYLAFPLILGSLAGLIPAALSITILVARTYLEDGTLQKELPGYQDYARKVKYRLLPRIW